jgi:Flp pilus assembly protein TadD
VVLRDRATRTISATITVPEYVQRRIAENSEESLSEVVLLSPTNALAWAHLGIAVLRRTETNDLSRNAQAEWCAKRALSLNPRDADVLKAVADIRRRISLH